MSVEKPKRTRMTPVRAKVDTDLTQSQMLEYTFPTTREDLVIKELLQQRVASATDKLGEQRTGTDKGQVRVELEGGSKTLSTGGRPPFNESIMQFAYYQYAIGGAKLYETLVSNSNGKEKLPSLRTVKRYGIDKAEVLEGVLQVEKIKISLLQQGLPLAVWLSEDDTKVISELKYSSKTNEIIGLDLPIGDDGLPITGAFKFTSVKAALSHVKNNPMSSYLKVVACRVLQKDAYKFIVLAYGTSAGGIGGQTAGVKMRWGTIIKALNYVDINVHGMFR